MAFQGRTFNPPPLSEKQFFPPGVRVEQTLQVWAMSRSRSPIALVRGFLHTGFSYREAGGRPMYRVEQLREDGVNKAILVHLTNSHDAEYLLSRVYWCACGFIAFTLYNVYTNTTNTFPHAGQMHSLPYVVPEVALVEGPAEAPVAAEEEAGGQE